MRSAVLVAALAASKPAAAPAGEVLVSIGAENIAHEAVAGFGLEQRAAPVWRGGLLARTATLGFGVAVETDTDGDLWGGGGVYLTVDLGPEWRIEASCMPGAYHEGSGNDLGATFPMIRSQIGASRAFGQGWRLGASLGHKSNADTADHNPGVETVFLTLVRSY